MAVILRQSSLLVLLVNIDGRNFRSGVVVGLICSCCFAVAKDVGKLLECRHY